MKHAVKGLEADSNPGIYNSLTAHSLHGQPSNLYLCPVHSHSLCSHIAWLSWGRFIVEGRILEFFTYRQYLGRTLTDMNDRPKYANIFISVTPPVPTTITLLVENLLIVKVQSLLISQPWSFLFHVSAAD